MALIRYLTNRSRVTFNALETRVIFAEDWNDMADLVNEIPDILNIVYPDKTLPSDFNVTPEITNDPLTPTTAVKEWIVPAGKVDTYGDSIQFDLYFLCTAFLGTDHIKMMNYPYTIFDISGNILWTSAMSIRVTVRIQKINNTNVNAYVTVFYGGLKTEHFEINIGSVTTSNDWAVQLYLDATTGSQLTLSAGRIDLSPNYA